MTKNLSTVDRIVRVVIAAVFAVLLITGVVSGIWATILGILAVVFLATSLVSFCPLYALFHLSTAEK
jgi:hypothetical protein